MIEKLDIQVSDKEAIIGALAAAMGHSEYSETKYDGPCYDHDTGTLYCNGYIISRSTVDDALDYFKHAKVNCDKQFETTGDVSARNTALYMQTAIEAIMMMKQRSVRDGGKVIVSRKLV